MNTLKVCGKIALYPLLALVLFYQVMGMWGVAVSKVTELQEATWLIPVWVVMIVLLTCALLLCALGKKSERMPLIAMILALLGAVLALAIALTLQAALPLQVSASNVSSTGEQGLDAWKLITRHYSPVAIGVITAIVGFVRFKQNRDERIRKDESGYEEQFSDLGEGISLGEVSPQKPSKKLSRRQRKEQSGQ